MIDYCLLNYLFDCVCLCLLAIFTVEDVAATSHLALLLADRYSRKNIINAKAVDTR